MKKVRRRRIRKIFGTPERMRLRIFRSAKHIYAQVIDDVAGQTAAAASSTALKIKNGGNLTAAKAVGAAIAKAALAKGIKKVCFDRGEFVYRGRIAALAQAARAEGLEF